MKGLKIRQAKPADFPEVFKLLEQLWDYKELDRRLLAAAYKRSLKEKNYRAFLAVKDGKIAGFAGTIILNHMWQAGTICHLNELIVDRNIRAKGIGSAMMDHIETYAGKKGCRGVELESAKRRRRTHKFYKARGYNPGALFFVKLFYKDR